MFKEFNVEFQDIEMIGGADNLLENTKVTKVVMSGDNKMSSLDSAFKNCSELDNIQGGLDLNGVSDIDNILEGNSLIKSVDLKNINNENISANNSFPNVEEINISGELYNKKAIQNTIASKDWTFDNIKYKDIVGDNVTTKEVNVVDDNKLVIKDALEQKAKEIEIKGQTYQNLIEGKGEHILTDTYSATWTESNSSFENMPNVIEVSEIWGNTVQNENNLEDIKSVGDLYIDEKGEAILDEEGNEQYILELVSSDKNTKSNKTTILMPYKLCRMAKGADTVNFKVNYATDKIYFDYNTKKYYLEKNIAYYNTGTVEYAGNWGDISGVLKLPAGKWTTFTSGTYRGEKYSPIMVEGCMKSGWQPTCQYPNIIAIGVYSSGATRFATYPGETWDNERVSNYLSNRMLYYIMKEPEIIELDLLEDVELETYSPKTYISTNTEVQPSQMNIANKKTMLTPSQLQANKEYTLQFECKEKGDNSIKFSLGGAEKEIAATLGVNHINITTLNELSNNDLVLSGQGNKISDVMLIEGDMNQYPNYFDGIKSVGALQDDNTYKIDIKTNEDFIISIKTNLPLSKEDRLYWNDANKRYEIDRNGVIEVPTVEGDVIDLPRLYQRTDTVLTVGTDTIKPSEIKVKYKDLN